MKKTAYLTLVLPAVLAAAVAAAPADPAPKPPESGQKEAEAAPAEGWKFQDAVASGSRSGGAEDFEWLVDAEGGEYRVLRYPKSMTFRRMDDGRVRILGGATFELLGEDGATLELRIPRVEPTEYKPNPVSLAVPPTRTELDASAATYPQPPAEGDRIRLVPFDKGLPTTGHWRNGFDLVDVNGDGHVDFVQGPPRKSGDQIRVFLGDGAGNWRAAATSVPPGLLDYGDVRVADVDGDGKLDLIAAVHLRGVLALHGDGNGAFVSPREGSGLDFKVPVIGDVLPAFSSRRLELVDWNGDGKLDILAYSEGPTSTYGAGQADLARAASDVGRAAAVAKRGAIVYLNEGHGKWKALEPPAESHDMFGDSLAIADFNGDRRPDFALSSNLMGATDLVYLNLPKDGGFKALSLEVRPRSYMKAVVAGDWNGDGRVDLAYSYVNFDLGVHRVGMDLYFNEGNGKFRREGLDSVIGRDELLALAAGDLDRDGFVDIVGVSADGNTQIFLGDGKGHFTRESSPEAQQPRGRCRAYAVRLADVDGDGGPEIVSSYADEPVTLYDPQRCTNNGGVAAFHLAPDAPAATAN